MRHIVVLLVLIYACDALKFGQLCSCNPTNRFRTSDSWGEGHYGAGRVNRLHKGVDVVCNDGATVYAPFDLTLHGGVIVYTDPAKAAINKGINIRKDNLCFKLFYVDPVKTSGSLRKGEPLGTMLPMQSVYAGITSHVHVQLCNKADPTSYF